MHGIPNKLQSDNGPPYSSHEFQQFMTSYDKEHVTGSPHYPQDNGKEKNAIKTAKNLLKKAKTAGSDFYLALLEWRNTPSEGLDSSSVQRIFGRRTRTLIPTTSELLKPKIVEDVQGKLAKRKQQAKHYNISAKKLPPLGQGEIVRVKPTDRSGRCFKARVERQVDVRSNEVRTEDGKALKRNRRHLRNSKEPACIRDNLEPICMPVKGQQSESPPSPNLQTDHQNQVRRWRYHCLGILKKYPVPRNLRAVPRM